jgi:hypothetical protein
VSRSSHVGGFVYGFVVPRWWLYGRGWIGVRTDQTAPVGIPARHWRCRSGDDRQAAPEQRTPDRTSKEARMNNTRKRRAMELLDVVAQRRGDRNSGDRGSPAGLGHAARAAAMAVEAATVLSMARRIRSGRGHRVLPIIAAVYLARHIGTRPQQRS